MSSTSLFLPIVRGFESATLLVVLCTQVSIFASSYGSSTDKLLYSIHKDSTMGMKSPRVFGTFFPNMCRKVRDL